MRTARLVLAASALLGCSAAPAATPIIIFVTPATFFDDFTRADANLVPSTSPSGHVWGRRGPTGSPPLAQEPVIESNRLTVGSSPDAGPRGAYAHIDYGSVPYKMGGTFSFSTGTTGNPSLGLVSSIDPFGDGDTGGNLLHLVIGRTGWVLQVREGVGAFVDVASQTYTAIANEAAAVPIGMVFDGDTATITGPDGVPVSVTDSRIGALHGRYVFWQMIHWASGQAKPRWDDVYADNQ